MRVLILRPAELLKETLEAFRNSGIEAYGCPFVSLQYQDFQVPSHDFAIVTSQNSAREIVRRGIKLKKVIAIGNKTAELLRNAGYEVLLPKRYESSAIVEDFRELLKGKRVIAIRSEQGSDVLRKLAEFADYSEVYAYKIVKLKGEEQKKEIEKVKARFYDVIVFSSRMIAESFLEQCDEEAIEKLRNTILIAIGTPTAEFLEKKGLSAIVPDEFTFEGIKKLIKALRDANSQC
ncbi:MAG: uroporphyrinogen-III synthase [Archaeoglobaceae archaeon]|nr:uroporphyrinogen-III synthase [Archaeoglobaceae archaeon]MDW8118521.1 uroporphyrinogen-III synthase [Archaeoglobaceae archaeon]